MTALAPFWKAAQSYWNADGCRDFTPLGYTYPEFIGLDLSNKAQLRSAILAKFNSLYGNPFIRPQPRSLLASTSSVPKAVSAVAAPAKPTPPSAPQPAAKSNPTPRAAATATVANPDPSDECYMVDWRVRVLTPKYKLGGTYSVLVFLGPVPEQISEWRNSKELVGTVEVFANIRPEQCANCRSRPDLTVEGWIHLNQALIRSPLHSFEPSVISPYLKENLHWRVTKVCSRMFQMTIRVQTN